MAKLIIIILTAFFGGVIGNTQLTLVDIERTVLLLRTTTKVHADIVAKYQPDIDALASQILLESKVETENIALAKSTIESKVKNSADTLDLDITIVKNQVQTNLKKPAALNSAVVKSCLNTQLLYANALSTTALRACYVAADITELTSKNSEILLLKSSVISLAESCRSQHPLASDSAGMVSCIQLNLSYSENELEELLILLNDAITSTKQKADACVLDKETTLSDKISDILVNSVTCLSFV